MFLSRLPQKLPKPGKVVQNIYDKWYQGSWGIFLLFLSFKRALIWKEPNSLSPAGTLICWDAGALRFQASAALLTSFQAIHWQHADNFCFGEKESNSKKMKHFNQSQVRLGVPPYKNDPSFVFTSSCCCCCCCLCLAATKKVLESQPIQ